MATIRTYHPRDREAVERICTDTATGIFAWRVMRTAVLEIYCRYYIGREPENCFVACDENDRPVGYILCADDFNRWSRCFRDETIRGMWNPLARAAATASLNAPRKYASEYPAHLHVDILPAFHRQGIGTALFSSLREKLAADGVPGVMLSAGAENKDAVAFYRSLGFTLLEKTATDIVMGLRLNESETK